MVTTKGGLAAMKQQQVQAVNNAQKQTIASVFNAMLDSEGYRTRVNELMKERAAQWMGSMVELVNANPSLQEVFAQSPITIFRSCLKAAAYDLPLDNNLGYSYILPFKNKQSDGSYRMEAQFIMGYRGMLNLAIRTGVYKKINVIDIREGELISYNRLTEDIQVKFIEDEEERNAAPIIGFVGYYRLINGMEKTIYMSRAAIDAHEEKHRKGKYRNPVWSQDWESMASKTVLRKLIGKWGIMSVDYKTADRSMIELAENAAKETIDDEDSIATLDVDVETAVTKDESAFEPVPQEDVKE